MDRIDQMRLFARVVETGSFSTAAKAEQVAQSTVSKQVAALEMRLGAQLLRRTPRGFSVTEQGRIYHSLAVELLADFEAADAGVRDAVRSVNGHLRVSTAPIGHGVLISHLPRLFAQFPDLSIDLDVSERTVNLVEEGFDVAIRIGKLRDTNLIATKIGCLEALLVASPQYLNRHGVPKSLDDLKNHTCLPFMSQGVPRPWYFKARGSIVSITPTGMFRTNNVDTTLAAVISGLGISQGPSCLYGEPVREGLLKSILREYTQPLVPLYAVTVGGKRPRSGMIKSFIEFFAEVLSKDPYLRKR